MIGIPELLLGVVFATIGVWSIHRLAVVAKIAITLRKTPHNETVRFADGQTVAVEGPVFVDESAPVGDRLFDSEGTRVGAYLWQAWFPDSGRNTYDFDEGELQQGKNTFASGIEAGNVGVTTSGQTLYIDFSWLDELYDTDVLSELEVGNPVSNATLPTFVTRHIWDGSYITLTSAKGECSVDRLTDVVSVSRDDVATEEFTLEARGITEGHQLFVHGELRVTDGAYVISGSDSTPLLVADTGRQGLLRHLQWRALKYVLALLAAIALGALFIV